MGVRTLLHSTSEHNARSDSDQLGTKKRRPREAFPQPDMAHSLLDAKSPLAVVSRQCEALVSRSLAMKQRNCNIGLREMLGGASLIFLIAAGVSICTANDVYAAADGGAPAVGYVTTGDASSNGSLDVPAADGNLDVPAPAADYNVPADGRSVGEADPGIEAVAGTDNVLELPQVVDPANYAVVAPASANLAPADSDAALANAEAALTDSDSALSDADDGGQPGSIADNAAADAPSGEPRSDAPDYQDQADSGPVTVYAAPVYMEPAPAYFVQTPDPAPLALGAGAYNQRPIANLPRPHAGSLELNEVGTGIRLFNSRVGQGFVMQRRPMAMAGRGHPR